ncbi:MAG: hypothetical protein RQ714_02040 [Nitrosomonas sp.]|nr:hypothetical protein [Nitrosomonas sp.]
MALKNSIKEFADFLGDRESLLDQSYPRIAEKIELLWRHNEVYLYLDQIMVVEKGRERSGFPLEVMKEFQVLREIHAKLYGETTVNNMGSKPIWRG